MGLFDVFKKKDCEICGKEVGMFGYKKLEDGEICKDCVKLLSPWFDDRRHATVEQIKAQLAYREENRAALDSFRPTASFGENYTLRAELANGMPVRFVVERGDNYKEENADLISFKDVTSFEIDINDSYRELKRKNNEGEMVSYVPPRYEYSYDFYAVIRVNNPYFDVIRFKLNRNTLNLETVGNQNRATAAMRTGLRQPMGRTQGGFDPNMYPEYRQYQKECDDLEELFRAGMQGMMLPSQAAPQYGQPAPQYGQPAPQYGQPAPQYGQPAPQYGQPTPQYGQPAPQYGQPTPQYGQPAPQYGQPAPQYGQPAPQYGQPAPQYGQPAPQYGQPAPQYGQPTPQYAQPAPRPATPALPAFCPSCGAPTEGSKFCQCCGSKLV